MDPRRVLWVVEAVLPSCALTDAVLVSHPLNSAAAQCSCVSPQSAIYFKRVFEENPYVGLQSCLNRSE